MNFFLPNRCPKFGRGGGGSAEVGTMSQLLDFFFYGFPNVDNIFQLISSDSVNKHLCFTNTEQYCKTVPHDGSKTPWKDMKEGKPCT